MEVHLNVSILPHKRGLKSRRQEIVPFFVIDSSDPLETRSPDRTFAGKPDS